MSLLAIDPGDLRTGVARLRGDGLLLWAEVLSFTETRQLLEAASLRDNYVVERWRLRDGTKKIGSEFEAIKIIGMVELASDGQLTYQDPSILKITAQHMHITLPKGHLPDDLSATLHGYRWFIERGLTPARLRELNGL